MKKQLICMLAAAAMLPGATVFAAGSYDKDNKVTIDNTDKKTVMIVRNTGAKMKPDDVVYLGQANSGFSGTSAIFALKENPAVGFYTIMLGGDGDVAAEKSTFFIGTAEDFDDKTELQELEGYVVESEDGKTVTKAYVSQSAIPLQQAKSIVVKDNTKSACTEFGTVTSGDGNVMLAVKLVGIPVANKDNVQVWISSTEISTEGLITE